ncbi:putative iron-regulated membrane protein [Paraburkholderia caballeronis]|uniref:PepSY-associated TM helix domain-containing protein n=1 Tax=Paraburkholderia caballeronis TaxID=416943 RepID=UPI001064AD17|nr:PepSY-associated TM helix domain-containing protein [Paraburkholderia caballeronis]TDV35893.1 putative iron-regulated membrane protein [Paraburkholderia caballeronis]
MTTQAHPPAARAPRLRRYWLVAHRWFALSFGRVLALMGVTGALLMIAAPLDHHLHPELFSVVAPDDRATVSLESVRQRLAGEFGPRAALSFHPLRFPQQSLEATVRGKWSGAVYVDPYTGRELGRRAQTDGFFNLLFRLHSSLLLDQAGKPLLACVALVYLLLLVSGLVLWWPRAGSAAWRIELRRGRTRALYDLHRVGGASLGLVIALSVATGAYMAWRPLAGWVTAAMTAASGAHPARAPSLPARPSPSQPMLAVDALVARARAAFPDGQVNIVQMPAKADAPLRVRMRLPDDPHPNGLTSVWIDPYSGAVLAAQRWDRLDPGARAVSVIYPLHTGALGGPLLMVVLAVGGLASGGLSATGLWQWWRRRKLRRARVVQAG